MIAEQAVAHADRSGDPVQREINRGHLAFALTTAGALNRAEELFAHAEAIRAEYCPEEPLLITRVGYWYGDLLLARGHTEQAFDRACYQLDLAQRFTKRLGLHAIGLGHLLIGRAQEAVGDAAAATSFDAAIAGLRRSGLSSFLPFAFLARAAHLRRRAASGETDLIDGIRADLAEVEDIAGEEMRFYLTDLALERARLALDVPAAFTSAQAARAEAEAQTASAAALITDTGYHRRNGELAELQTRLAAA